MEDLYVPEKEESHYFRKKKKKSMFTKQSLLFGGGGLLLLVVMSTVAFLSSGGKALNSQPGGLGNSIPFTSHSSTSTQLTNSSLPQVSPTPVTVIGKIDCILNTVVRSPSCLVVVRKDDGTQVALQNITQKDLSQRGLQTSQTVSVQGVTTGNSTQNPTVIVSSLNGLPIPTPTATPIQQTQPSTPPTDTPGAQPTVDPSRPPGTS